MGGRLSMPRSPDGTSEISRPVRPRSSINARTLTAPLAALTMAGLLFIYSRTSIRAAKLNAQKHREADGGQISWHNESLRRHGARERIEERGVLREALLGKRGGKDDEERAGKGKEGSGGGVVPTTGEGVGTARSVEEERLRRRMGKGEGEGGGEGG